MTLTTARPTVRTAALPTAWAWESPPCAALDYRFDVRVETPELRGGLEYLVAPLHTGHRQPGRCHHYEVRRQPGERLPFTLSVDGERMCAGRSATDLSPLLAWHINNSAIAGSTDRYVLLHSAAITVAGLTVILPADMESGKTTTAAGLLRVGFEYVTDEAVAIDPATGSVTPFPKLLSLDPGSWPLFPECRTNPALPPGVQWYLGAPELGGTVARGPVPPPRLVVFPRYVEGARTEVQSLTRAEALQELVRMTFAFREHAGRNLRTLGSIASHATVARLVIGSLDGAVAAVEELVSQRILEEL